MAVMPSGNAALPDTKKWIIDILLSERAFVYKIKLEVIKRQGFRTDLTSSQLGTKLIPPILQMEDGEGNHPHICGGIELFEERETGTADNILFSDGKCGLVVTVKGKKNLSAL